MKNDYAKPPYYIHSGSFGPELHANPDEGDSLVADIAVDCVGDPDKTAEFICCACNAHKQLLATCQNVLDRLTVMDMDKGEMGQWLRAALESAGKGE